MPSQRRVKAFGLILVLAFLMIMYITSAAKQTENSEFYKKTVQALDVKQAADRDAAEAESVKERVQAAAREAKRKAEEKAANAPKVVQEILGTDKSSETAQEKPPVRGSRRKGDKAVGEKTVEVTDDDETGRRKVKDDGVARSGPHASAKPQSEPQSEEEREVELELNAILKKSPIIIFSKTYCPFSKKAKRILLDKYKIVPAPYVVEIDENPLGEQLQAILGKKTGRRTVPNILINGKSIGGGDDIEALDEKGTLAETVKSMGGKRIVEAHLIEPKSEPRVEKKFKS